MAAYSTMLELGTELPRFSLPDVSSGSPLSSDSLRGSVSVVAFICNHCPYVKHIRAELARFGRECAERGVKMIAISSNDITAYPDDAPEPMAQEAKLAGYTFPYLFDEDQSVARAFRAACTPEFYAFDAQGLLAYRGRFDAASPKSDAPPSGNELRAAVDALLRGDRPEAEQKPSIGCNIKWKP
ncbi:MAG TPA: thioredoxin family protein [Polyangiaceae bacterium]|nr:thioredoxin family protein [Polyangiaceae bacterium]